LKQPIIAINEAEIVGTVDGVVIKGNKVSCIYSENMENQFTIPVENVIIGADAVMIMDMAAVNMASMYVKPIRSMLDIYNTSGSRLGYLQEIEVDEKLNILYISSERSKFDVSKMMSYESVIIVDMEVAKTEKVEVIASEDEAAAEVSMDIGPDINWNDENVQSVEKAHEGSDLSVVRAMHQTEEKVDTHGVDEKYAYLCGKKLLEGIDIEDIFYEKGTIIDANLIKHAIGNNTIVKVIVNAEE
jgi:sporulation protein YlmC with PRC-barrel domain